MEVFQPTRLDTAGYRSVINQSGHGMDMDRYIYSNQSGEGIGSFFGNLLRTAIPLIGASFIILKSLTDPIPPWQIIGISILWNCKTRYGAIREK